MAKTINLTVKVEDAEFKQFQQNFNEFTDQIKQLTEKFQKIGTTIDKTTQQTRTLTDTMRGLWDVTKGIGSSLERATGHLAKWAALIGGVSMMLGTGAGLFGIDRLARTLMEKRRQMMGISGDFGRTQAAAIATGATLEDPMGAMQQIRLGQQGLTEQRRALQRVGISGIREMEPADALIAMIRKTVEVGERARRTGGQPMRQPEVRGLIPFLGEQGVARLIGPEGRREAESIIKEFQESRKRGMKPEDARTWAGLYRAAQAFVQQIQTSLGTALSGIAGSLTQVSKGFTDLLAAFLEMPGVKAALEELKTWLDGFASYLRGDDAKKKLEEWSDELEKVNWKGLGETISSFIGILGSAIDVLKAVLKFDREWRKPWISPQTRQWWFGPNMGISPFGTGPGGMPTFGERFGDWTQTPRGSVPWIYGPGAYQGPTFPINPVAPPTPGTSGATPGKQGALPSRTQFAAAQPATQPARTQFAAAQSGGIQTQIASVLPGFAPVAAAPGGGGGTTNITGPRISNTNLALWRGATSSRVPQERGEGVAAMMSFASNNFYGGGAPIGRARGKGPLDIDNWQLNRTASLRIDNVAGSNVNMTAVRMG
jgi:hypothetical protein